MRLFLEESESIKNDCSLIFYHENSFIHLYKDREKSIETSKEVKHKKWNNNILDNENLLKDTIFPLFDYSLTYSKGNSETRNDKHDVYLNGKSKTTENRMEIRKKLNQVFPSFPQKSNMLDFFREDIENQQRMLSHYQKMIEKYNSIFKDFFIPNKIGISTEKKNLNYLDMPFLNVKKQVNLKGIPHIGKFKYRTKFEIKDFKKEELKALLNLAKEKKIRIEIFDNEGKNLEHLSFGEQQLLKILNTIYFLANNHDNIIFSFDEIDIGLHPEWQKKVFKHIIDLLKEFPEKNFHLILSSHSPFLLSDIPKQNIIFIDKEEKGNAKVVDGLKQTFGANIHTLLTDSFFMESGLMGEFAKQKINEIIKNLKDKEYTYTEKEKTNVLLTIESIGEPFLQKIVKNQLEEIELILLGRDEAIDKEIARLQALKVSSKNA